MKKTMLFVGSVIILILSAITFIFIPAMADGAASQSALVFGKYGNKKIEYKQGTEFANAVANYTEMYRNQGAELRDSDYYYIYNYAFVSAVQAVAYADSMNKAGYKPSEGAVARQMLPYFSDENGKYSSKIFNSIGEEEKSNLKRELTKGLVWNRYSEDLLGSQSKIGEHTMFGLKKSAAEKAFLEDMASTKRSFDMAVFNKADYPDSAVAAFGTENKDKFVKYNLSVITMKDSSKAKSVLKQIKNEEITFADAVSEYSDKAYSGSDGNLSSNFGYQLAEIITKEADADKIYSLAQGDISDVIETSAGYSFFRCNLPKAEPDFADKTMLSNVRSYINNNETSIIENYFTEAAKKLKESAAAGFEKACTASEAKYVKVPAFAVNYDNASIFDSLPSEVTEISGADSNENFFKTAFALKAGDISEPVVCGDKIVVLKVTGEQKDTLSDEKKNSIIAEVASMDSSASQQTLLNSDKVKNNVADVFFNKIMKNN